MPPAASTSSPAGTSALPAATPIPQQSISDPSFPAGVDHPPGVHDFTGSAALDGGFGRTIFTLEGKTERTLYENGTSGGAVVDQGDRNNTVFGGRLRLGYESPLGVTPFVEGEV